MSKAQGLSLSTIVIAAIALVVLVVLIIIFSGKTTIFSKGVSNVQGEYDVDKCEIPGTQRRCEGNQQCSPGCVPVQDKVCSSGYCCQC